MLVAVVQIGLRCGWCWLRGMGYLWRRGDLRGHLGSMRGSWHHVWGLLGDVALWGGIALGRVAVVLSRKGLLVLRWHVSLRVRMRGLDRWVRGGVCLRLGVLLWWCRSLSRGLHGNPGLGHVLWVAPHVRGQSVAC